MSQASPEMFPEHRARSKENPEHCSMDVCVCVLRTNLKPKIICQK